MSKINVYEMVTNKIIEQLEKGIVPWRKPWFCQKAINYITRKPYRGVNILLLEKPGEYLTFHQCKSLGGKIKKDEKSTPIVFYKMLEIEDKEHLDEEGNPTKRILPYLQYSNVFHIDQCEGITSKIVVPKQENNPIKEVETVAKNYIQRENIRFLSDELDEAYYSLNDDLVHLPSKNLFKDIVHYYSTLFHEFSHSTGHPNRLNRDMKNWFGDEKYSKEELIAEISSSLILNDLGIDTTDTFNNSVAYINNWLKVIKGNNKTIVEAAGKAQKASDYILNIKC
jgi:antirestriction protein ArdC